MFLIRFNYFGVPNKIPSLKNEKLLSKISGIRLMKIDFKISFRFYKLIMKSSLRNYKKKETDLSFYTEGGKFKIIVLCQKRILKFFSGGLIETRGSFLLEFQNQKVRISAELAKIIKHLRYINDIQ